MNFYNGLRMNWGLGLGLGHTSSRHDRHGKTINLYACRRFGGRDGTWPMGWVVVIDQCHAYFIKCRSHIVAGLVERVANFISSLGECFSGLFECTPSLLTALECTAMCGFTCVFADIELLVAMPRLTGGP
jgi:hypothetical protein